jgi:tetratricopeptide (TPR) repeat protein
MARESLPFPQALTPTLLAATGALNSTMNPIGAFPSLLLPGRLQRRIAAGLGVLCVSVCQMLVGAATPPLPDDPLVREALAAEARLDTPRALELFQRALQAHPDSAFLEQKLGRQYSDSEAEATTTAEKLRLARLALQHSLRAAELEPNNAVNVLSVAISYGKIGILSDVKTKIAHSRLVREGAERALALDPNYSWAHDVLGRWHHEVASLGTAARWIVKLVYGGLPAASLPEGISHLQRAVALAPENVAHHLALGFALVAAGREPEARAAFDRGLALPSREKHDEPDKARARAALARLKP